MSLHRFVLTLVLVVPALALFALGAEEGNTPERAVIVPQDATPFKVDRAQLVRLVGEGIAGSKIVADVDGPATVVAENLVMAVKGGHIMLGMEKKEFEIRPTGPGTVKVTITTTFLKAVPSVKVYEFDVK
jgi:hypothetical protein